MNCVATVVIGDAQKAVNELTGPNHKAYADRIGAEYVEINESRVVSGEADHEIFQLFQMLNKYERIIYLDCCTLVRDDCPSLFDEVPKTTLGAFNKAPFTPGANFIIDETFRDYGKRRDYWNGEYYDISVLVCSRQHKFAFKVPDEGFFHSSVERYINMKLCADIEMWKGGLKYKFNRMSAMDSVTGEERYDSYIINYKEIPEVGLMLSYIKRDMQKWAIDKYNGYQYKRHILIEATAGLGDQITAEPVVRRCLKLWPNADIRVATDYPRIFKHLEGQVEVTHHKDVRRDFDGSFFAKNCNPAQNTEFSSHVDGILSPIIDFASLSVLKRVLSDEEKLPHLEVTAEDINNVIAILGFERPLEDYVLIHAGKHWETNCFPVSWWEEVVNGINNAGVPSILIGKQIFEPIKTGYVPIEAPDGVVDTRDLLDLGSLFALISKACMLLTNDSSPVHIASAFDNDIVVLPTVKLGDHLIPIRHGARTYRSKALYKKMLIDELPTQPTSIYGESIETMPNGLDILDFIPEPKTVIDYVVGRYKEIHKLDDKKKGKK